MLLDKTVLKHDLEKSWDGYCELESAVKENVFDGISVSKNCFIVALLLSQARKDWNSILPCIIIHGLYNLHLVRFIVYDYADRFQEAQNQLKDWLKNGTLKYRENIIEGFENIPAAFQGLFSGDNIGKQLVRV